MTDHTIPLGATLDGDRVAFRVWAPFADEVAVVTDDEEMALDRHDDGTWSGRLAGGKGLEYLYRIRNGDDTFDRIDPRARAVTNSNGRSVVTDPSFDWTDGGFSRPSIDELVIYELHTGTFGDDLDGVAARLDHLAESGFTAVEIMPVAEFAGDMSWGYNTALPFAVESSYGGPEALRRLVDRCHAAGLAVIIDVVFNHLGPSDLSMWRFDGWHDADGGGIYFYNDRRSKTPWGDTRPDYGRPEVRQLFVDNARMWFEEFHADGLRLDSTINIRTVGGVEGTEELPDGWLLLQELSDLRDHDFPGRILIAEDLQGNEALTQTRDEGGAGFDAQWDADFVHPVRRLLESPADEDRDPQTLVAAVAGPEHRDGWGRVVYTESHDEVANGSTRVVTEINPDDPDAWFARNRALSGLVAALTARGIPMMFQGQEWLEDDYFRDDEPVEWENAELASSELTALRRLIRLRSGRDHGAAGLRGAGFEVVALDDTDDVVAYHRWRDGGSGDDVLVAINLSNEHRTVELAIPGNWDLAVSTDADSNAWPLGESAGVGVDLAGYASAVFAAV